MNPLGQLFGLIVEQIPGFAGGFGPKFESQREMLAIDLLFAKALGECDKQAMREFATQHLGANIVVTATAPNPSVRKSPRSIDLSGNVTKQLQSQSLMTSFLKPVDPSASYMVTKAIVESGKKQKEEKQKEEKKKEEAPKKKRASKSVKVDA
jgi:hypothetical protein